MAADEEVTDEDDIAREKRVRADLVSRRKTFVDTLHKKAVEVSARAWNEYDHAKHGGTRDSYVATQIAMEAAYALGRKQAEMELLLQLIAENALKSQGRLKTLEMARAQFEKEHRDQPRFRGAYQREASYKRGDWCVFNGSTWACMEDTTDAPGMQTKSWMIAARKGRDGN